VILMEPLVSIVVCVKDGEKTVGKCIESLLDQTFQDFELIMVDDVSIDRTSEIIKSYDDSRIKYLRNERWRGIAGSRQNGVDFAKGRYIFCTDADCIVNPDWIEEGLSSFSIDCVGVEGRIVYVREGYVASFSDYVMENRAGGQFMTGNVAYRKDILDAVGGFDSELAVLNDREVGLRVMRCGRICFNKQMIAYHPWVQLTPKRLLRSSKAAGERVFLFRKYDDKAMVSGLVLDLPNFLKVLFPLSIFGSFFFHRFSRKEDYRLLPYAYVAAIVERFSIWKACVKLRVFLI
jgi:glycosyltransferase involved in cell wall biosynthesis